MRAAIYARYSSENQREASIEDQLRLCRERIAREGWVLGEVYSDARLSGASRFRPGYQQMLLDAKSGAFEVVVAEALDRLSRDQEDTAALFKALSFADVQLITLAEGEITELHVGLKGTMNALFLRDLAAKTRRGLRGRVEAGRSAGGRCYGYRVSRPIAPNGEQARGEREIDAPEAAVVRRIFEEFVVGKSPRAIARQLNAECIAGPDGRPWLDTTLRGHAARGTGILRNELYVGRLVWNRQRFVKDPATGKRLARPNPPEQWIRHDLPELRIIGQDLWDRAQARLGAIAASAAATAIRKTAFWLERRPRHLLSGLVHCGVCGHPLSMIGKDYLACGRARRHGLCSNRKGIRKAAVETLILDALKRNLMAPELVAEFTRAYHAEINASRHERQLAHTQVARQLAETERKLQHLVDAMAEGIRAPALQQKLDALEAERQRLEDLARQPAPDPIRLHPNLGELYRRQVEDLQGALTHPATRDEAFTILRDLIEQVSIRPGAHGVEVELEGAIVAMVEVALGSDATRPTDSKTALRRLVLDDGSRRSVKVVAGRGFEPLTFRL
jgi:site-specific DNA recombinase